VTLAAGTLLLAFVPGWLYDAGCDVERSLASDGACTEIDAGVADAREEQSSAAAADAVSSSPPS
jgi:hypothetical protein